MATGFHLAQANVARCRAPLDTPIMRDFVELLPAINALADASHGFVWRLQTDDGDATAIRAYDDPLVIFNMSVWTGLDELNQYVFRSSHLYALRRRRDWFEPMNPSSVMWWIPSGYQPQVQEGRTASRSQKFTCKLLPPCQRKTKSIGRGASPTRLGDLRSRTG